MCEQIFDGLPANPLVLTKIERQLARLEDRV